MLTQLKNWLGISYNQLVIDDPALAAELDAALTARAVTLTGDDLTSPLRWVPSVLQILDEARLDEVLTLVAFGSTAESEIRALGRPEAIDPAALAALVTAGVITTAQAAELGTMVERYFLSDEDLALVNAIGTAAPGASNAQLAEWTASQWVTALTGAVSSGLEELAEILTRRLEVLFPASAWLGRLVTVSMVAVQSDLDVIQVLEARNPTRFAGSYASLDRTDVPSGAATAVESAWNRLAAIARRYAGLALDTVFDTYADTTAVRATEATIRTTTLAGRIGAAGSSAPRTDLLGHDLSNGSSAWSRWDLASVAAPLRPLVVAAVRTVQRMRALGGDLDTAGALMLAGFTSATQIARLRRDAFVAAAGLPPARGSQIWDTARRLGTDAALYLGAVVDQLASATDPPATQPPPTVGQQFTELDGYASVFGNQAFCDCKHCASVLGPAAYFVDLMEFVKDEVDAQVPAEHRLRLRVRRPDLWTTPLTCEATHEPVPTLTIVNEVLENDIARRRLYTGPWSDRAQVEEEVYQDELPSHTKSFAQPFLLGIERASAALRAFGVSREELGELSGLGGGALLRLVFGLSTPWETLLTSPKNLPDLRPIYGLDFPETAGEVEHVESTVLAGAMGIDRTALSTLVTSWFVGQGGTPPEIVPAHRGPGSVQYDMEWVEHLSAGALDRMHRLSRLAAVLGQPVTALDRQLRAANDTSLNTSTLLRLLDVAFLAHRVGEAFGEDDAVAFGAAADQAILDRRFNRGVPMADHWPDPTAKLEHPAFFEGIPGPTDNAAARLAAGLGLTSDATATLIRFLAGVLEREFATSFDPQDSDPAQRHFLLSAANLIRLDHHARLIRLLGLGVGDLVHLMELAGLSPITSVGGALAVARARDAWKASGRTLDQLAVAGGLEPRKEVAGFAPVATRDTIRNGALNALAIEDTIFATGLGLSTQASLDVIAANPLWFEQVGGHRVVNRAIDPATQAINVPGGHTETDDELRAVLLGRTARTYITRALATATKRSDAEIVALYGLARSDVGTSVATDLLAAVPGSELGTLVTAILRVSVATLGWSVGAIELLTAEPLRFAAAEEPVLTPSGVRAAPWFSFELAAALGRAAPRSAAPALQAALVEAMTAFDRTSMRFDAAAYAALATLLGIDQSSVGSLQDSFMLGSAVIGAIDRLSTLSRMCRALGVDGRVLKALISDIDVTRAQAAAEVDRAAAARAEHEPGVAKQLEEYRQDMRERCRNAMVDHLLRCLESREFGSAVALAGYFLLDVSAGGCATTSRVVAATGAVQEYVTRITLGLERNELPPGDPAHFRVVLSDAGRASWEWRRSYRVWEANRKVFLWPENYLEGTLRDDKTPLFVQLEEALAQSALDEGSILSAYASYLESLDELAALQIAGAYHDVRVGDGAADKDVLHLFGVTDADPPVFYYRSVTDLHVSARRPDRGVIWSAWLLSAPGMWTSRG